MLKRTTLYSDLRVKDQNNTYLSMQVYVTISIFICDNKFVMVPAPKYLIDFTSALDHELEFT